MNENKPNYGKKVFFLTQNKTLQTSVRRSLLTMEYEVYYIDNYKILKNLLSEDPDSIVFITLDRQLKTTGWKNFIKSINLDSYFSLTKIGLLIKDWTDNQILEFSSGLTLEAEITQIDDFDDGGETLRSIVKILDKLDAKGMRQYVRANCTSDKNSQIYWLEGNLMHKLNIMDISSVGVALMLPAKNYQQMMSLKEIPGAKISINNKQCSIPLNIYAIKQMRGAYVIVAMFKQETAREVLSLIRDYISEQLLKDLYSKIVNRPIDKIDYDNLVIQDDII